MPSAAALAVENRGPCYPKEVFFVKLCKSGGLLLPSPRSLVIPWPTPPLHALMMAMYLPKISCRSLKFIASLAEWKLQLDEVTREKQTVEYLTRGQWNNNKKKRLFSLPPYLTQERWTSSRQVLRSAWGQTESKIRFGSGPGRPKFSNGPAAFFDSIFDLEPSHRPKPSIRTKIRFAKPLYYIKSA